MQELFQYLEKQIKASGYPGYISGEELYDDICDEMDGKENGAYLLMIQKGEGLRIECRVIIGEDDFDLPFFDIYAGEKVYHVDLEAE